MRIALCSIIAGLLVSFGCDKGPPPKPVPAGQVSPPRGTAAKNVVPDQPALKVALVVRRGEKVGVRYPLYQGKNYLGRADKLPVDIDFDDQEPPDRIWTSRQHALITAENDKLVVEDLKSANGTFVNRHRVYPGKQQSLIVGDTLQVGTVVMQLVPSNRFEQASSRKFRLVVLRGEKVGIVYPIYPGDNYIGRADELSVDIDLDDQERPEWVWSSRQHAIVACQGETLTVEDLKSANGSYVNRQRVPPGKKQTLTLGDTLQVGTVVMKVVPGNYQAPADAKNVRKAQLVVVRGLKAGLTYPIYEGTNYIGRAHELSVDVDLDPQEADERIWTSRQHALITCIDGKLSIEDLKSANGTHVNRMKINPGEKVPLKEGDELQLGTAHLKVASAK
jgi:pSer/pThr/pTyr-binding forkhead associated (FHA) protein